MGSKIETKLAYIAQFSREEIQEIESRYNELIDQTYSHYKAIDKLMTSDDKNLVMAFEMYKDGDIKLKEFKNKKDNSLLEEYLRKINE